jgi:predicted ATPase
LALNIADKFHAKALMPKIIAVFSTTISIWKEPIKNSLSLLKSSYQTGLEMGISTTEQPAPIFTVFIPPLSDRN